MKGNSSVRTKKFKTRHGRSFIRMSELHLTPKRLTKICTVKFQLITKKVLAPFQRFMPIAASYPYFSVLFSFQRFIPISFYPHFGILSSFRRFSLTLAFYPHFSILSPFQRFIPISAFYPHFSSCFQFALPLFSFSVLS